MSCRIPAVQGINKCGHSFVYDHTILISYNDVGGTPAFDTYGLLRAKHVPLAHSTLLYNGLLLCISGHRTAVVDRLYALLRGVFRLSCHDFHHLFCGHGGA